MKAENMEMHIEAFRCYKPQPGDVLIVKPASPKETLSNGYVDSVKKTMRELLPSTVKVLVFPTNLDIEIIRNGEQQ